MKKVLLTGLMGLSLSLTNSMAAESTLPLVLKPTYLNYIYSFQLNKEIKDKKAYANLKDLNFGKK